MSPSLRRSSRAVVILLALAAASTLRAADELVVAAEPAPLAPGAAPPLTVAYSVVEIFQGEPGGATLHVRHDELSPDDLARLRARERVILIARRDEARGAWSAPAPLRATPSALAAFRKWSAPEDVREARPVGDVVSEIAAEPPRAMAVAQGDPSAAPVRAVAVADDAPVAAPVRVATVAPVPRAESGAVAPARVDAGPATVASEPRAFAPPLLYDARVQPPRGPGLPPEPSERVLGPEPADRADLDRRRRGRR